MEHPEGVTDSSSRVRLLASSHIHVEQTIITFSYWTERKRERVCVFVCYRVREKKRGKREKKRDRGMQV